MTNFSGSPCSVCKELLNDKEKLGIVICPDCGAPYHRGCYNKDEGCVYSALHKNGFVWEREPPEKIAKTESTGEMPMETVEDGFFGELRETLDRMGWYEKMKNLKPEERFIYGVSEKEIAHFQGGASAMRFIRYRQIEAGRKININVIAGLLSPFYMFYSRMRVMGIIIYLITFLFGLPYTIAMFYDLTGTSLPFSTEALAEVAGILGIFNFGLKIVIAIFYDYFYLRWMARKIKLIRCRFFYDGDLYGEEIDKEISAEEKDEYYRILTDAGKPGFGICALDTIAVTIAVTLAAYILMFSFL
ncbi:MAG: hypothetical protein FWG44_04420 [Oscillospiraceae bacterium]|nr:hypothetical protein [Oscillospiraceae bacterium]